MPRTYDNWERLVDDVLKKEQLWQLFHAQSRSPSISSESSSSGFSFSFRFTSSSIDDVPFSFPSPDWSASDQEEEDAPTTNSSIRVKDQTPVEGLAPVKSVTVTHTRKRNLKIQVPKPQIQWFTTPGNCQNISPRMTSPTPTHRAQPRAGGHFESQKQQSYPLPLPPAATSRSPTVSRPTSAATSPLPSPERGTENVESPWKRGKFLGRGPLGAVYLGFNSEKGEMCAMKEVTLSSDDAKSRPSSIMIRTEIGVLSRLKHPNIVQYHGAETVGGNLYIYFEYVSGGSIYAIMQEYGKLQESAIRNYTQQILSGLAYLHSKSISHRNIKSASILADPSGTVKLSSFGFEKQIAGQFLIDDPYWMAPEAIMNPNVRTSAADIWSLGCTVIEMATSKPPTSQYGPALATFKVANHKELPIIPDNLSNEGKDFLRCCLQWNPQHRATASQLLEHPFVKSWSPLGKQILVSASSSYLDVTIVSKSESTDRQRSLQQLDSGKTATHSSRASKSIQASDIYTPRNISPPITPVGSPLPRPTSPQHHNSDIYTPRNTSPPITPVGSSLPHPNSPQHHNRKMPNSSPRLTLMTSSSIQRTTGGIVAIPYLRLDQSILPQGTTHHNIPKPSPKTNSPSYWDPNILKRGAFRIS